VARQKEATKKISRITTLKPKLAREHFSFHPGKLFATPLSTETEEKSSRLLTIQITNTNNCDNSYLGNTQVITGQKFNYNMTYFNLSRY
jgi:hypothetical protein